MEVLVVHNRFPVAQHAGSDVRLLQLISAFQSLGHKVTLVAPWFAESAAITESLRQQGATIYQQDAEMLRLYGIDRMPAWNFSRVLRERGFDLAVLCLWFWHQFTIPELYLEQILKTSPRTRIAVLSDDQHGAREAMLAQLAGGQPAYEYARNIATRESEALALADGVVVVSDRDRVAAERRTAADVPVFTIPFQNPPALQAPGFANRSNLLFLGNFENPVVRDAAGWLLDELLPRIRERLPGMMLTLAGHCSDNLDRPLPAGCDVLGFVEDLQPLFHRYLLFLSPLRAGTGIATKNLMAFFAGLPVVTTEIGAAGLPGSPQVSFRVAADAGEFAEHVYELCTNEQAWTGLAQAAKLAQADEKNRTLFAGGVEALCGIPNRARAPSSSHLSAFSNRLIDGRLPHLSTCLPAAERKACRFRAHLLLGKELLAQGVYEDGMTQLRHALTAARFGAVFEELQIAPVLDALGQGYAESGDKARAASCRHAAEKIRAACLRKTAPHPLA